MNNKTVSYLIYCRGNPLERETQRKLLGQLKYDKIVEDDDESYSLCPALQQISDTPVTVVMTELSVLRGTPSAQLKWLRKWFLSGHHLITLDGVIDSIAWPETAALIAVLAGHNPKATQAPAGRPSGLSEQALQLSERAETLYSQKKMTSQQSARRLGVARSTYYRYLNLRQVILQRECHGKNAVNNGPSPGKKK